MRVVSTVGEARSGVRTLRDRGDSVGVVPTMGALHDGHLSLVRESRRRCQATVASIFVNPTQFAAGEDLDAYPRTLESDLELLESAGVDLCFVPTAEVMYPEGFSTFVEPPEVARPLEGVCRPGFFRGVCTVVLKLFAALPGTHAFFGRKDYQQWRVVEAMVRELNLEIRVVACEIVREADGLAMSSRNRYLGREDRERAVVIWESLREVARSVADGESSVRVLQDRMRRRLTGRGAPGGRKVDRIDYAVVVDGETLRPVSRVDARSVALVAAHVGPARLIDNRPLSA